MSSPEFAANLDRYAEVIVKIGLNVQPGQRVLINAPIEAVPLVRLVAEHAYRVGATLVTPLYGDDAMTRVRIESAPPDSLEEFPEWLADARLRSARNGDALLAIVGPRPGYFDDLDHGALTTLQRTAGRHNMPASEIMARSETSWLVVAVPTPEWAARLFPELAEDQRRQRLWDVLFDLCRVSTPDPYAAWKNHVADLEARVRYLNARQYRELRYTGPGTDLSVGLVENHIWEGGAARLPSGIPFVANIPTEEVFTMPHRERTSGVVRATMPLDRSGVMIEDFSLRFEAGRVVDVQAGKGEAILRGIVDTDDGAGRLGEVALVPNNSPIARSGLLFLNTLFDENAASHLALGQNYPINIRNGTSMSAGEMAAAGGNHSMIHVDFMIGSGEIDVDGVTAGGSVEPVMRRGEWTF